MKKEIKSRKKCPFCESEDEKLRKDDKGYYLCTSSGDGTNHLYINVCPVCGRKLMMNKMSRSRFKKYIHEKSQINQYLINSIVDKVCDSHFENENQLYDMLEKLFDGTGITRTDISRLDLYR